jgi:hypothetical protein
MPAIRKNKFLNEYYLFDLIVCQRVILGLLDGTLFRSST